MAEYIDKQIILDKCQRLIDVERKQGSDVMNYGRERVNQTEVIMEYIEYMTPTTDVIERAEFEEMVKSFKAMVAIKDETLIDMRDKYYTLEKEYAELKININKAIKEIEQEILEVDYHANKLLGSSHGMRKAIDILKRNIGE